MATADETPDREGRRLSISERAVREIVENAILRLQLELAKAFASQADVTRVADALRDATEAIGKRFDSQDKKIEQLELDKAGRDSVTQFKRYITGGALLGTIFMAIQVGISIWLVSRGTHKP